MNTGGRAPVWGATLGALLGLAILAFSTAPAFAANPPVPITHQQLNSVVGLADSAGEGGLDASGPRNLSGSICSTSPAWSDADTTCEAGAHSNETTIAVNPTDPLNVLGSSNDFQLSVSAGGAVYETVYPRAHVSFDGGRSWTEFGIEYTNYGEVSDPAVAFDATGRAYLSALGFPWSQCGVGGGCSVGCCVSNDLVVATSADGGQTWARPTRVAAGSGSSSSKGVSPDKEEIVAWGDGNAIVTWTAIQHGIQGAYVRSPIYASVTHDGGKTWAPATEISGSASICTGAQGGHACDQSQGSVPVRSADGSIYVSFLNYADAVSGRDQYLVVKVDASSGARIAGPYLIARVVDGFTDYPINAFGLPTYQDSQFRSWAFGPITADPTNATHLAMVWSDMRNSQLPAPSDPYQARTNSDIIVSQSFDGGRSWSGPTAIAAPGDQFQPWAVYDSTGKLRIGYYDRSYDPVNHSYGYTLATETEAGSLSFNTTELSTALSDPTQGDRWFSGLTPNPSFPHPTQFLGDYSGVAASGSSVVGLWTDMRQQVCFTTRCGSDEDAFFTATP